MGQARTSHNTRLEENSFQRDGTNILQVDLLVEYLTMRGKHPDGLYTVQW